MSVPKEWRKGILEDIEYEIGEAAKYDPPLSIDEANSIADALKRYADQIRQIPNENYTKRRKVG